MRFYLIGTLVTLIPLGSLFSWAFKPYCDDGLLGISPTILSLHQHSEASQKIECWWPLGDAGLQPFWSLFGSLDLSGAYKLQSKMAWNVDAVVRYCLSVATEYLVFTFPFFFCSCWI